jgi:predicted transcriptional regulator
VSGVISLQEVQHIPADRRSTITVEQTMQPLSDRTTIAPQVPLTKALAQMAQEGSGRLLVMQNTTLQGMITKTGLLRFLEIKCILEMNA